MSKPKVLISLAEYNRLRNSVYVSPMEEAAFINGAGEIADSPTQQAKRLIEDAERRAHMAQEQCLQAEEERDSARADVARLEAENAELRARDDAFQAWTPTERLTWQSLRKQAATDEQSIVQDVRLGRMVRNLPANGKTWSFLTKVSSDGKEHWELRVGDSWMECHDTAGEGATPEQALEAAGVTP